MNTVTAKSISFEDYLKLEQETNTKYEYHNGEVFAMAGGTIEHGTISGNVFSDINVSLESSGGYCRPFNSDVKLHIVQKSKCVYPDAMVICGKIEKSLSYKDAVVNPTVIIEVLSDSTADYDRGDKFHFYRSIPSLQEYVLISQDKVQVEIFERKGDLWKISKIEGFEETLLLPSIAIELSLARIYRNVEFGEVA